MPFKILGKPNPSCATIAWFVNSPASHVVILQKKLIYTLFKLPFSCSQTKVNESQRKSTQLISEQLSPTEPVHQEVNGTGNSNSKLWESAKHGRVVQYKRTSKSKQLKSNIITRLCYVRA